MIVFLSIDKSIVVKAVQRINRLKIAAATAKLKKIVIELSIHTLTCQSMSFPVLNISTRPDGQTDPLLSYILSYHFDCGTLSM